MKIFLIIISAIVIIAIIASIIGVVHSIFGCNAIIKKISTKNEDVTFIIIESSRNSQGNRYEIIADKYSGAMYYKEYHVTHHGLYTTDTVPLYNPNGTIRIYNKSE
ncbi:hypothetical protein IKG54_00980 [Candidatus Saccharibacteria bacterium]|nr:hypothetical protein [Candidatus Saccharibacteria bacterium]